MILKGKKRFERFYYTIELKKKGFDENVVLLNRPDFFLWGEKGEEGNG